MSTKSQHSSKTSEIKALSTIPQTQKLANSHIAGSSLSNLLFLQKTIGNKAVQRIIEPQKSQHKINDLASKEMIQSQGSCPENEEEEVQSKSLGRQQLSGIRAETKEDDELMQQPEEEEKEELGSLRLQEKLTMGTPGDVYEQEADSVAEAVSSQGSLSDLSHLNSVQQQSLSSLSPGEIGALVDSNLGTTVSKNSMNLNRLSVNNKQQRPVQADNAVSENIERQILQSKGKGNSLPAPMRSYMAIQTGYDFSNVRVKTDSEAASLNSALGARAFANGSDIWLGRDEKISDVRLMAHELTHVVQQGAAKRIQPQSNAFSQLLASKGYMPKFMQALTNNANRNSHFFRKSILQFISKYPSSRMDALHGQLLDGASTDSINRRESAQTLRGSIPSCKGSSKQSASSTPTLKKSTVSGPTAINCGGFSWGVQWSIDNATSSTNGWVVQKVSLNRNVKDCSGTNKSPGPNSLKPSWYPLWEAWQVRGGAVYIGRTSGRHNSDTYGQGAEGNNTKGSISVLGTAEYYDGLTLPSSFKVTNKAPTWSLPATKSQPSLSGGTGSLSHNLTATWDCCTSNKTTTLTTT